jgi:hypothetical protein
MKIVKNLLLIYLCFACTPKQEIGSGELTGEAKVIEEKLRNYYEDMSARDWKKYRSHFWDQATIATAWQTPGDSLARVDVTTIDDFIEEAPAGPGSQPVFEEYMTQSKIEVRGTLAVAWANYEAKFGKPDSLMQWKGIDVFTFLFHENEWKIVSLTFESSH